MPTIESIIYQKLDQIINDACKYLNKHIHFTITGEKTDMDEMILKYIQYSLIHLVRNACDHGIEKEDERYLLRKHKIGHIHIDIQKSNEFITVQVQDDGRGIDIEELKKTAINKGLIEQNQILSYEEYLRLIFLPGFTTKQYPTPISGYGQGMSVVQQSIEVVLNGKISIYTQKNKGTCFQLQIPNIVDIRHDIP